MSNKWQSNGKGIVNFHGKQYKTVILRVNEFRTNETFKGCGIKTQIIDPGHQTGFVVVQAFITDSGDRVIGSGLAEEKRGAGNINKFSALENCETSAIGRALASIGLGGEEYCSADELHLAINKQDKDKNKGQIIHLETLAKKEKPFDLGVYKNLIKAYCHLKNQSNIDKPGHLIMDFMGLTIESEGKDWNTLMSLSIDEKKKLIKWLENEIDPKE